MSNLFPYSTPGTLTAVYDEATNGVDLAWGAPSLNNLTVYDVPGSYTYTPLEGWANFQVTVIGGGGGGGGAASASGASTASSGAGAGGAGFAQVTYAAASISPSASVTVGAAGVGGAGYTVTSAGGTGVGTAGTAGGASTFSNLITANGGAGGPPGTVGAPPSGGAGGTASVTGGSSVTTETGGAGGGGEETNISAASNNVGASTTYAGAGGGGGGYFKDRTTTGTSPAGGASGLGAGGAGGSQTISSDANASVTATNGGTGISSGAGIYVGGSGGGGGGAAGNSNLTPSGAINSIGGNGGLGGSYGAAGGGGGIGQLPGGGNNKTGGTGGNGISGAVVVLGLNLTTPLTGYAVYRDGAEIGTSTTTTFTDPTPLSGDHVYTIAGVSGVIVVSPLSNPADIGLHIVLTGEAAGNAGSDVLLRWTADSCADTQFEIYEVGVSDPIATLPQNAIDGYVVMGLTPDTEYQFYVAGDVSGDSNSVTVRTGCRAVEIFNCDCSIEPTQQTLAELRTRMMIRLGYPNQAASPPPGMSALIDAFLYDAQKLIWKQLSRAGLNVERFFRWIMVPGQRYYGIDNNADKCDLKLDPYKIVWAGFEDLNRAWYRLTEGIAPEYYTRANINFGWPTHYEVRSCIEIFPAPQAPYTLWIKGDFGLASFVNDNDTATIDDQAVFLLALGTAKQHYGQKDGAAVLAQADTYVRGLVAGLHGTRRYVPRTKVQNPATPPRFLPLGDAQA